MFALFGDRANGRRLALGVIAIAVLLVVDVILIALALRAHDVFESTPLPTGSQRPLPASESSSTEPQPTESGAPTVSRLLSAVSGTDAWRAESGACGQPGAVEMTTDAGETWTPSTLALAGPVLALERNADGSRGFVVVADAACEPTVQRTFSGGLGWELAPDQALGSYVTAQGVVMLDGTSIDAPCEDPQAVTASGGGVVLCAGVAQARTSSGGWVPVAQAVTAIGPAEGGVAVALRSAEGCEGMTVGLIRAGALQSACTAIPIDSPVAVSEGAAGQVWAWVGDALEIVAL
ncbi:hypothetical protein [Agrococcus sp. TF02-05]|uniref:hypothetical protein n=1 Tax=Agrococcus sp. TF02-05 TaxID=2815211 RepID=UPI001AA0CA29|nr:hypothetical protein [Agrococcus sp. TF02-05]MBO1769495.1 hypothetical protein [Agrococcus sp. TF02-05]